MGVEAVFGQVQPPVEGLPLLLFPDKRANRRRQQPEGGGRLVVVGRKIDLQLDAGAAARRCHGDSIPHQEDHPILALGIDAAPGVIRCPFAKAHPAGPVVSGVDPAPHFQQGIAGGAGVPAHVQVAEGGHGEFRRGVAAVGQIPPGRTVQHQTPAFQRNIVQLPAGEGLGPLQNQIVPLFHDTRSFFAYGCSSPLSS